MHVVGTRPAPGWGHGSGVTYLEELLEGEEGTAQLRPLRVVQLLCKEKGWNRLPGAVRASPSLTCFRDAWTWH